MTEIDLMSAVLQSPWFILILSSPGTLLALMLIVGIGWLARGLGKNYIEAVNRQAAAMEKMADTLPAVIGGVNMLQDAANKQNEFTQEMRMSMQALSKDIRNMSDRVERINK